MDEFLERLKRMTGIKRGWQKFISQNTGIPETTISSWKTRKSEPRYSALKELSNKLGYSLDYLITGKLQKTDIPKRLLRLCEALETLDDDELADVEKYTEYILSKRTSYRTNGRVEGTA